MGTYAVTGSASGMGRETVDRLRADGHRVIGVDLKEADVVADLSTHDGRARAVAQVISAADGHLDGAVLAAGIGPGNGAGRARLIAEVNYRGVVELLEGWRPALAAAGNAKVVVISSNSTTTTPMVPERAVKALLAGDVDKAVRAVRLFGPVAPALIYAASKIAVSRWVRRHAVRPEWARAGIRLNALAPGAIMTPLLEEQLASPRQAKAVQRFPVPVGGFGDAGQLADWIRFMLSDAADFLCGSIVFVDGGTDAHFRPDDWPEPVPARRLVGYLRRFRN
ncbi:SDR family oxidoreductase [Mycolicibacterium litorale]|uniref:NAD-dependent epimerase n=1 Tax=Mycolicibacterium litorale TaxID=758802 RepID=A0AAD1IML7_9MYCO|nr:SDR family oxidoreductase [Mycolicibacterium litorale]MCV7417021.1 SDR family oxidoreductase [Mycolicibacterium litorale]TDY04807.1 NAD(P)-dependent dehydrogenase (short-subunit alcohol dehydrogenase family) [Mycolicibacterium litorale]BBY18234.1 NAD-dependent epimerase [Mycolicibacterium litorale]